MPDYTPAMQGPRNSPFTLVEHGVDNMHEDIAHLHDSRIIRRLRRIAPPHRAGAIPTRVVWIVRQSCTIALAYDRGEDVTPHVHRLAAFFGPGITEGGDDA